MNRPTSKLIKVDAARSAIDDHRDWILECLHAVETAARRFSTTIASTPLPNSGLLPIRPVTVFEPVGEPTESTVGQLATHYRELNANASRQIAASAFSAFNYEHEVSRNQSLKCIGVVGAPGYVIEEARRLNNAKDDLKEAFQPISNLRVQVSPGEQNGNSSSKFREVSTMLLRETGRSSTNLLAAYRHIPIVSEPVHAIRFLLTNTRSVPRVSVADLRRKASHDPKVLEKLSQAHALRNDEWVLAPKRRYLRMRAKVLLQQMASAYSRQRIQKIISAELPILFPMLKADSRWPDVRGPRTANQKRKSPPSRMEEEPLVVIGAQPYFRLKAEHRR